MLTRPSRFNIPHINGLRVLISVIFMLLVSACTTPQNRVDGELAFDKDSLVSLGDTFKQAGDYSSALRLYHRAAKENPKDIPSRMALANLYSQLGTSSVAEKFYRAVLVLAPGHPAASIGLAQSLISQNKPDEAVTLLETLKPLQADNIKIYNSLGLAYDLQGQHSLAQMEYARGMDIAPDDISLINNFALSLAIQEEYAPSIKLLSQIVNQNQGQNRARANLAMVYSLSGEEEAATELMRIDQQDDEIGQQLQHYRWLKTLSSQEKAQAIFLGIKNFKRHQEIKESQDPANAETKPAATVQKEPAASPLSPEQQKLLAILENDTEIETPPVSSEKSDVKPEPEPIAVIPSMKETAFLVQLGSYLSIQQAEKGWAYLQKKYSTILEEQSPFLKTISKDDGQTAVRLFVDGSGEKTDADVLCDAIKNAEGDCLVLKTQR